MEGPGMSVCRRTAVLAFAMLVVLTRAAFAADTGSVSGAVFDQTGKPVAGVTVKISGDRLPAGRTAQTDTNGAYKFEYLPTGSYTVEFDKTGVGTSKRAAIVDLDKETQIDVVLGMAVKEELTVTAATPVVDTKST